MTYSAWTSPNDLNQRLDAYRYDPVFIEAQLHIERSGIRLDALVDRTTVPINYGILQPRSFIDAGVPMVRAVDLGNPFINPPKVVKVPHAVELPYRRSRISKGDVLISIAGTLGRVGIVPGGWPLANLNQSVARIRTDGRLDSHYLVSYLMSPVGRVLIEREAVGSVQRHLNIEDIRPFRVPVPEPAIQHAIGNKVRKAERLRELAALWAASAHTRMDQETVTFEAAPAQSSWIVAKALTERMDTQPYRTHFLALRDALHRTSSDRLSEVATMTGGDPVSSDEFAPEGVPLVRIRDIRAAGFAIPGVCVSRDYFRSRSSCAARSRRIVLGMDGDFRAQFFIENDLPRLINQRVAIIDCKRIRPELLVAWLNRPEGQLQLARWTVQTTVAHTSLSHIRNLLIPRLGEDDENWLADSFLGAREARAEAAELVAAARQAVESLIDDNLDEPTLLAEGEAIERWLAENPSSHSKEKD